MLDPTIKARLLAMPEEFQGTATKLMGYVVAVALDKERRASREAVLVAELATLWQDAKTNEQIRKAQTEVALRGDPTYSAHATAVQDGEMWIKRLQVNLDALRFEAEVLSVVAYNDHSLP